ncbi:MAG TPA: radical SAM protein [Thermodesulfobacteriota bacterium]|nr:radical SAM protein [Thermodesulfobacteriota bacterium]HNU71554.1 radical SAM protein [Thermodesulfobacteriota bacterium]
MKYVFGPVASRRLKRSLGIDCIPCKTCTLDCIYCEVGSTTTLTVERREYVPCEAILDNLREYLDELVIPPDYITLGGSGEPTLHSRIGMIIQGIKALTTIPVAVLTNGSLLFQDEVKEALLDADVVLPSLDAIREATFQAVNRPHPSLDNRAIIRGLREFRRVFTGQIWLEVLLCQGINDSEEEIEHLTEVVASINPDTIHLNTVDRPPAVDGVRPVAPETLSAIRERFGSTAEIVAASFWSREKQKPVHATLRVIELLRRRPGTVEDIAHALRISREEAATTIAGLIRDGAVHARVFEGRRYYHAE